MSTKTVKLNANLHEELKKIAEKEGFVLQDLIEEKLNEVLEEKGSYHFQPTDVQFSTETQLFNVLLSPVQYQALIILLKRLCLNEKVNNITQMNMIIDAVKKMEMMYKRHESVINDLSLSSDDDLLNTEGFYRTMLHVLNNPSKSSDLDVIEERQEPYNNTGINIDDLVKALEEHHLTKPMFESKMEQDSDKLLKIFDKENYLGKMAEDFWNSLIDIDIKNGKCFKIKVNSNDVEISKLESYINELKPRTMIDNELYFLYRWNDDIFFVGDFFNLLKKYNLDIDVNVVETGVVI